MVEIKRIDKFLVEELYRSAVFRSVFHCSECDVVTDKAAMFCPGCGREFRAGHVTVRKTR